MRKSDRGAEALEFALVLPVLLLLVMGIIEFGFALFVQASIAGGAREAARDMAIHNDTAQAQNRAITAASPAVTLTTGEIAIAAACSATPPGQVIVTINHSYTGLTGFFPAMALSGRGVMRCGG